MTIAQRIERAFEIWAERRDRDAVFGEAADGFGEPAWDMLLLAYAHCLAGSCIGRRELVAAAGRSPKTAEIYLEWMGSRNLIAFVDAEGVEAIHVSDFGRSLMDTFLDKS